MLFCRLRIFLINLFFEKSFRNKIRMSNSLDPDQARQNSLDPDQARQNVGPNLGPNCLQRLSTYDTGTEARRKVTTVDIKIRNREKAHSFFKKSYRNALHLTRNTDASKFRLVP